jgi:membrane protease YdiL (CAAX protease family)
VWIASILQQTIGVIAVLMIVKTLGLKLFGRISGWLYILPCLIVAIDNFQFYAYFQGKMQFVQTQAVDVLLFAVYCTMIGLFEELIFRGVLFSVIAGYFSDDKKGLWKTFILSSLIFGGAHLFNLLYGAGIGATLLQAVYTTLTGGLFAFAFIKTKNILIPAFLHAVYNFCGLLFSEQGLGLGAVLDFGTGVTMAIVGVVVGVFVLYSLYKHPEKEQKELYACLNVHNATNA